MTFLKLVLYFVPSLPRTFGTKLNLAWNSKLLVETETKEMVNSRWEFMVRLGEWWLISRMQPLDTKNNARSIILLLLLIDCKGMARQIIFQNYSGDYPLKKFQRNIKFQETGLLGIYIFSGRNKLRKT